MKRKHHKMLVAVSVLLAGVLWLPAGLKAQAEEGELPAYHEYTVTEEEAIDHWYGVARGVYMREGICGVKRAGTGKVSVSGTTFAHSVCDKVKVGVYLDEGSNKTDFGTIGVYHFEESNASSCYGSKANIPVTSGLYYRVRAVHSVIEGSVVETISSATSAISAS